MYSASTRAENKVNFCFKASLIYQHEVVIVFFLQLPKFELGGLFIRVCTASIDTIK